MTNASSFFIATSLLMGAMPQLVQVLQQRQQKTPEQPVVIAADKDVRYEAVLKVMDELQRAQIQRVGLLVRPAQR